MLVEAANRASRFARLLDLLDERPVAWGRVQGNGNTLEILICKLQAGMGARYCRGAEARRLARSDQRLSVVSSSLQLAGSRESEVRLPKRTLIRTAAGKADESGLTLG